MNLLAAGKYGFYVPFFNGLFHGIVGRVDIFNWDYLQELNLAVDRAHPGVFVGYRGGFTNQWRGWFNDTNA